MQFTHVPNWPPGFVTTTSYEPAALAGAAAVSRVPFTKTTLLAAVPPTVTVAPLTKFAPLMVMLLPPVVTCGLLPVIDVTLTTRSKVTVTEVSLERLFILQVSPLNVEQPDQEAVVVPAGGVAVNVGLDPSGTLFIVIG